MRPPPKTVWTALALAALQPGCASGEGDGVASAKAPTTATASKARASRPVAKPPVDKARTRTARKERAAEGPRVYAKTRFVWVRPQPGLQGWIGYLWFGGSVRLKSKKPHYGPGCSEWYAVEPRGFVCVDGKQATLDAKDPALQVLRRHAPKLDSPWPHEYGESRDLQRYKAIPDRTQQRRREWDLVEHLDRVARAKAPGGDRHDSLKGVDLTSATARPFPLEGLPATVHEARSRLRLLSTVAYSSAVRADDRSWLLSADLMWVPKDRVAPYKKVTFRGVKLGVEANLPLAFFRGEDRPKYKKGSDGGFVDSGKRFKRKTWVELTGKREKHTKTTWLETKQAGMWVKRSDAVVPEPQAETPWGSKVGGPDSPQGPSGRRTWIEASVWKGWLVAFEGTKPVYATMISPGRGGTPAPGIDPLVTAATPTGSFRITGKFATATMVAPDEFIHSDVPWTQNFSGPHALHGAYWHDNWGNRMSAGCVNVSPIDGKFLYEFTEPPVPEGWHGVRWRPSKEPATLFIVHN